MIFFLANVEFRACPVEGRKTIAELSSARKRDLSRNVAQAARLVGKPRQRASQGLGDDDERSESRRLFRFIHFLVIVYSLNAFFSYTVVLGLGYDWETALAACRTSTQSKI